MRRALIFAVMFVLLGLVVFRSRTPDEDIPADLLAQPPDKPKGSLGREYRDLSTGTGMTPLDQVMAKISPDTLAKMTNNNETAGSGHTFQLKSDWVGVSNVPSTSLKMRYNPETGTYEFLGAEMTIEQQIGLGYEDDPESGETKGYLQLRKSF